MDESMNSLMHLIDYINEKYESKIEIGVGGQGLSLDEKLLLHSNLHVLKNMDDLIKFLDTE
jgi:hypothetical protein